MGGRAHHRRRDAFVVAWRGRELIAAHVVIDACGVACRPSGCGRRRVPWCPFWVEQGSGVGEGSGAVYHLPKEPIAGDESVLGLSGGGGS